MNNKGKTCILKLGCVLILLICFSDVQAGLKTTYVENICEFKSWHTLELKRETAQILKASPNDAQINCMIFLEPSPGNSVVLSIFNYKLDSEDNLTIIDSDSYIVSLIGENEFPTEKKSFISEGRITVNYFRNGNATNSGKRGFQFTVTQVKTGWPCSPDEFRCKNQNCIPKVLACNKHNHCGDNSDQKVCVPKEDIYATPDTFIITNKRFPIIIYVIVGSIIILAIIITVIVLIVRRVKAKKANKATPGSQQLSTVASINSVSPNAPQRRTVFNQIRRSLRLQRSSQTEFPEDQKSPETYEVPALYPNLNQLPSAPGYDGVNNPSFTTGQ